MSKRNVCVVLVDRANYGRLKPVLKAIAADPELNLSILASGTMVLSRFGKATQVVQEDGFAIDGEIYMELEGGTPETMAKSIGIGITECCNEFRRLKPDIVLLIGDRYEALSAAIAAAYMNLCLVHLQGGEVSGSIDESARHAITKFAHYHYPATARSAVLPITRFRPVALAIRGRAKLLRRHCDTRFRPDHSQSLSDRQTRRPGRLRRCLSRLGHGAGAAGRLEREHQRRR